MSVGWVDHLREKHTPQKQEWLLLGGSPIGMSREKRLQTLNIKKSFNAPIGEIHFETNTVTNLNLKTRIFLKQTLHRKQIFYSQPATKSFFLVFEILRQIRRQRLLVGLKQAESFLSRHLKNGTQLAPQDVDAGEVLEPGQASSVENSVLHNSR